MTLAFEELAVLLSLERDLGVQKSTVAWRAYGMYGSERFDYRVALSVIDKLLDLELMFKDKSGFLYISPKGKDALKESKENLKFIFNELMFRV